MQHAQSGTTSTYPNTSISLYLRFLFFSKTYHVHPNRSTLGKSARAWVCVNNFNSKACCPVPIYICVYAVPIIQLFNSKACCPVLIYVCMQYRNPMDLWITILAAICTRDVTKNRPESWRQDSPHFKSIVLSMKTSCWCMFMHKHVTCVILYIMVLTLV